jgi:hypothetical protein
MRRSMFLHFSAVLTIWLVGCALEETRVPGESAPSSLVTPTGGDRPAAIQIHLPDGSSPLIALGANGATGMILSDRFDFSYEFKVSVGDRDGFSLDISEVDGATALESVQGNGKVEAVNTIVPLRFELVSQDDFDNEDLMHEGAGKEDYSTECCIKCGLTTACGSVSACCNIGGPCCIPY